MRTNHATDAGSTRLIENNEMSLPSTAPSELMSPDGFGAGGAANGWMSREWNLAFSLGALFLILSFSTAPLLRERREGAVMRAKDLLRHCLSVVIISGIMIGVLIYNLQ